MITILNRSGRQQDSDPCSLPMDGGPCRALKPRFVKALTSRPNLLYFVSFSDQSLIIALPCQSVTESLIVLDFECQYCYSMQQSVSTLPIQGSTTTLVSVSSSSMAAVVATRTTLPAWRLVRWEIFRIFCKSHFFHFFLLC